jgi:hypothetical protein
LTSQTLPFKASEAISKEREKLLMTYSDIEKERGRSLGNEPRI